MFRHVCVILKKFQNLCFAKLYKDNTKVSKHVAVNIMYTENIVIYICALAGCNNHNSGRNTSVKFLTSTSRNRSDVMTVKSANSHAAASGLDCVANTNT
jgi:hypothetical protein